MTHHNTKQSYTIQSILSLQYQSESDWVFSIFRITLQNHYEWIKIKTGKFPVTAENINYRVLVFVLVKSWNAATCLTRANIFYEFQLVWANPKYILWPLALKGNPVSSDELRATEKVMTCTMLCVGLIIKAASVGIGPRMSGSALQSSNTSEISPLSQLGKDKLMIQCGRQMKLIFPVPDRNWL